MPSAPSEVKILQASWRRLILRTDSVVGQKMNVANGVDRADNRGDRVYLRLGATVVLALAFRDRGMVDVDL